MEVDSIDNTEVYKEFIRYDEILRQINISNDLCPKEIHLQLEKIFSLRKRYINFVLRYQKIIELNSPISFMIDKLSASINEVEKIASNQLLNTDQKRSQSPALLSSLPSSLSSSSSSLSSLAKKADSAITTVITDKVKHVKDKFMIEFEAQIDDEDSTIEYDEDETKFEIIKSKKILWQQEIDRILRKNNSRVLVRKMSTFAQNFAYETSFERHQKIDFVLGRIVSKYSEYINIMMPMIIQVADALRIENKQEVIANWAKIKIINGLEHDNATFRSRKGSLIESEFSMTMKFVRSSLAAEESKSIRDFYGTFILISEMYKKRMVDHIYLNEIKKFIFTRTTCNEVYMNCFVSFFMLIGYNFYINFRHIHTEKQYDEMRSFYEEIYEKLSSIILERRVDYSDSLKQKILKVINKMENSWYYKPKHLIYFGTKQKIKYP